MVGTSGGGYGSAMVGSAYSTGQDCHAPAPNFHAAYNQPYEINGYWYHPMRGDAAFPKMESPHGTTSNPPVL
jgi:hypothetical protein